MSEQRFSPLLTVILVLAAALFTRAPFMMNTHAVSPQVPWADHPMKLVQTPQYATKKTDIFTSGATHMALLHNAVLRGFNSIYLQAPHVRDADKADFIGYALTWHKFVVSHHDDEEAVLFPQVEALLDDKTVWAETHKEHEAFLSGLASFATYLTTLPTPQSLSPTSLRSIMSSFQEPFESHFHSEIATITALSSHPNCPKPGSPEEAAAAATFKAWGKSTVSKAGTWDVVPFFLLNLDGTAEEGTWASWPPMPAPIRWGLVNIAGAWYSGWWKFASCDAAGKPRELYAFQFPKQQEEAS